jgi:hypothetical protein
MPIRVKSRICAISTSCSYRNGYFSPAAAKQAMFLSLLVASGQQRKKKQECAALPQANRPVPT